jgi:PAS domain S-box-containing protein
MPSPSEPLIRQPIEQGKDPDKPDGEALLNRYLRVPQGAGEGLTDQQAAIPIEDRQFRLLAENIPTLCWMANGDGYIFWYNRRWYDYTGTTPAEMEGWGWQSVHHPDELPKVLERWTEAVVTGAPFEMTFPLRGADGVYRPFLTRVQPVRDDAGRATRWFGVNTDVSAQRAAEAALRRSETQVAQVLERMDEGFVLFDRHFRIVQINDAGLRIDGRRADELIGRTHWEAWPGSEDSEAGRLYKRVLASQAAAKVEVPYAWPDGRGSWFEIHAYPTDNGLAAFYRDITGRKHDEAALRHLNETLEARVAEAVAEQQAAQESLRQAQKMEAVGQLTGGIAHDFNNLLMGIAGSLEIIASRLASGHIGDARKFVEAAAASAARATALTQRLLTFARRQTIDPQPVGVNQLIDSMKDLLERTAGEQIRLEVAMAADLWPALCDSHQLENGLLNLAINARDAMPAGGVLTIATANVWLDDAEVAAIRRYSGDQDDAIKPGAGPPGAYVALSVSDTGTGMPEEVIARAFEPFFTTKPLGQGTGLGLSMLYGFARQSGGHLRIDSEIGHGTSVTLYVPRHHGAPAAAEPVTASPELPAACGETVLVVEDDALVRMLILSVLTELGYAGLEAADGSAGLAILESAARIDLLITDLGLPGLNGRQLADRARQLRPALRVLFVTGYAHEMAMSQDALESGMALINKPFALGALAGTIHAILGKAGGFSAPDRP